MGVAAPGERAFAQAQPAPTASARTGAGAPPKGGRAPYEGIWRGDGKAACRDEDGVDRMSIEGNRFYWYETRCRARKITAESRRSWTMRVSCEGEGQRYRARLRLSLPTPDRLIMNDAPVGPTKRQLYLRCIGR